MPAIPRPQIPGTPPPTQPQPGTPGTPNDPTPGPYPQNPDPGDPGGTGCDCTAYHRPGTSCWTICGDTGQPGGSPCTIKGQTKDATGKCACPPGQVVHNADRGCEPEGGELCDPAAHPAFNPKKGRIDESNPDAECYWCDFSSRTWQRGYCGPGTTNTAGAAGGAAKSKGIDYNSFPSNDLAKKLQAMIEGDLNAPSRFTPEVMQKLYGSVTQQTASRISQGQRDVMTQAARAGRSSRWGSTQAGLRAVRAGAETEQGKLNFQADLAKINGDYQDHVAALDRATNFLNSMRDNEYRYTLMGEQRRQFDANLALGYANLAQQRSNLQMQLQSQWDMMRALQGFYALLNQ